MKRHLLAAAACLLVATLGHHAQAFETGGEQLAPEINISPMTAALVQAAQARVFAGSPALQQQQLQQQQLAAATAGGSTGNPSTDRLLGIPANAGGATRALVNQQLLARAQSFATRSAAGFGAGGGDFGSSGGDPGGLAVGGVPVVNNITNVTNQSGVFNTVTASTTIVGNGNTAIQKIGGVGNGVHATTPSQ